MLRVVELTEPVPLHWPESPTVPLVACGDPNGAGAEYWFERATFALTETESVDRRTVSVPSISEALTQLEERAMQWPQAAAVCDDVLRAAELTAPALAGVIAESVAYSTLQSGSEFTRWLADRGPRHAR